MTAQGFSADDIDTSRPHSARMYDYFLGGKTSYEADIQGAEAVISFWPGVRTGARVNRAFMHRASRWLVREAGIRQFLDIGTGIPTEPNLHQVVQAVAPESRVVYADNDPIVLRYAQALLRSTPEGRTAYLHADATDPDSILNHPEIHEILDLSRPVGLSLNALLHYIGDENGPHEIVARLVDAMPSGSYLTLTHCTPDLDPETWERLSSLSMSGSAASAKARTREEILRFFDGLEFVEPGLTVPHRWRPEPDQPLADASDAEVSLYAAVARKP
ncbi:SAM-dependent methyltransferase [Streptomyces verrucosisporus]|uniref:SAM-dependent methyltransferase n=1 Tax=Streptomyces verrucosisporus TaxID=1695161 RepID=UPI0019D20C4A|nr:SAM-dependent methyltransferase [Streptomyces verrucosisporus]MBN3928132.1 SAM-dependent methyltransferase [Streptomyces verrucosisporus]